MLYEKVHRNEFHQNFSWAGCLAKEVKPLAKSAWRYAWISLLTYSAHQLASKQLVGMLLIVIVRKRLRRCFKEVRSASIGAGIMGMMVCRTF